MKIIFLINEGKTEDIIKKYSERLEEPYKKGILKNIKPEFILWIAKQKEPVEDVVDLVKVFEKNIQRLDIKDINKYSSNDLRIKLNDLDDSNTSKNKKAKNDATIIGKFDPWIVVMPHSRESSIFWGKDTTWCTAATKTQNLFLSYVGRKNSNIILYYIINPNENPRINPNAKISVGFIDNNPVLNQQNGGLSVNSNNEGMNEEILSSILKNQYFPILNAMKQNSESLSGKHPAKKQMEEICKNSKSVLAYILSFNNSLELKKDAIKNILSFIKGEKNENAIKNSMIEDIDCVEIILEEYSYNEFEISEVLVAKITDIYINNTNIMLMLLTLMNDSNELFNFNIYNKILKLNNYKLNLLLSKCSQSLILHKMIHYRDFEIRKNIALNLNTLPSDLVYLHQDINMIEYLCKNKNTPISIFLEIIESQNIKYINEITDLIIKNEVNKYQIFLIDEIFKNPTNNFYVIKRLLSFEYTPIKYLNIYLEFALSIKDLNETTEILNSLSLNSKLPGDIQEKIFKFVSKNKLKVNYYIKYNLVSNPNIDPLLNKYYEEDENKDLWEEYLKNQNSRPTEKFLQKALKIFIPYSNIDIYARHKIDQLKLLNGRDR